MKDGRLLLDIRSARRCSSDEAAGRGVEEMRGAHVVAPGRDLPDELRTAICQDTSLGHAAVSAGHGGRHHDLCRHCIPR